MDYFNSNFEDKFSDQNSDLPEEFAWENMKEGIYEKVYINAPTKKKKYWPILLLLLVVGCGGSWIAFNVWDSSSQMEASMTDNQSMDEQSIEANSTDSPSSVLPSSKKPNQKITISSVKAGMNEATYDSNADNSNISFAKKNTSPLYQFNISDIEQKFIEPIQSKNINIKEDREDESIVNSSKKQLNNASPIASVWIEEINSTTPLPNKTINLHAVSKRPTTKQKKPLFPIHTTELNLSSGIINWTANDPNNINHAYTKGFPSFTINPSLSIYFKPKHALQIDYEYTSLEEEFIYTGDREIEVLQEDVVVREVVNSLTGEVISSEYANVMLSGTRSYNEIKYNSYKLHTLSLGYRFSTDLWKRSSIGGYLGSSYLFHLNAAGKRLDDELDVISFNGKNPLFGGSQFGMRLGIQYGFKINTSTTLTSQIMTTKYLTNWEVSGINGNTRPWLYSFQIGISRSLKN